MAIYKYVALKNNKELFESIIEASDERNAREKIRNSGYIPVKVYLNEDEKPVFKELPQKSVHLFLDEKRLFTTTLQSMIASGIPIIEAFAIMENNLDSPKLRKIAGDIKTKITNGYSFSQALESYSESFGEVFIKICHAGEMSGELDVVLERLLSLIKKQQALKSKLIAASIYPAIVILIAFGVLVLLGNYVFPRLIGFANQSGMDIPLETSLLISGIEFFRNYWFLIIIFVCGVSYGCIQFFKQPQVKRALDSSSLNIPVVQNFVRYNALANFTAVLYVAYDSGVPVTESVTMAKGAIENCVIKEQCEKFEELIYQGVSMAQASAQSGIMPADLQAMLVIGEKAGKLGEMLKELSDIIDKKVFETVNNLSTLIGPAFLIILAVFVGFIVLAFYKFYYGMFGIF